MIDFLTDFFRYVPSHQDDLLTPSTFTDTHRIIMVAISFVLGLFTIFFHKRIARWNHIDLLLKIIAWICILNFTVFYMYLLLHGHGKLPLTFCPLTSLLLGILILTNNKYIFPFVFYTGIGGNILGVLLAGSLYVGPEHFRFYNFYLSHMPVLIIAPYLALSRNWLPNFKEMNRALFINYGIAFVGLTVNIINDWTTRYGEMNPYRTYQGYTDFNGSIVGFVIIVLLLVAMLHYLFFGIFFLINKLMQYRNTSTITTST